MNILRILRTTLVTGVGATALAACGGGNSDPFVAGTDVPTSATATSAAVLPFAISVSSAISDSSEPLIVGDTALATSETDEPDPSV